MSELDQPISNPTWLAHIRHFFDPIDVEHMGQLGVDLAAYEEVKAKAASIYFQTLPPDGRMPPDPTRRWSQQRSDNFLRWIQADFPFGVPAPAPTPEAEVEPAGRIRKNIRDVKGEHLETLKRAFEGAMNRDHTEPNSYFAQAAIHWLPSPLYCLHHERRYNPWHRAYLYAFENALRSVPGCENVTLPYWDITGPVPQVLFAAPFDKYVLPRDVGSGFNAGYETRRYTVPAIRNNIQRFGITTKIREAEQKNVFEDFDEVISEAHDNGHGSVGPTLGLQEVAAYDPIFWFFHANWDRLWWKWQKKLHATDLQRFKTTLAGSPAWLNAPLNALPPFGETADKTIDSKLDFDVDYEHPPEHEAPVLRVREFGSSVAARSLSMAASNQVSVRVKGVDRLSIPGSFIVHLMKDGESIAQTCFFQSMNPRECGNCREHGTVHFNFRLPLAAVSRGRLQVGIELNREDRVGKWFPLTSAGSPTLNIRHLLRDE